LDLESELGVDSIKRIEILHELQKTLPPRLAARMVDGMESFTRVKSLNTLVKALLLELIESPRAGNPGAAQSTIPPAVQSGALGTPAEDLAEGTLVSPPDLCPRWVLEAREDLLNGLEPALPEGLFLITEDKFSVAQHVSEALRQRGARTAILGYEVLSSPDELAKAVAELQTQAPIRGIVHLAALAALNSPETLAEWRGYTRIHSKSLFQLLKLCAGSLLDSQSPVGRVLSATLLGGFFGRDGKCGPGLAIGAGSYGLLNALKSEWPNIHARAIDFDHGLSPEQMAELIIDELLNPAGQPGVGYPGGTRTVFLPVESALKTQAAPPQLAPTADWVVLVTGGARGITAEVVRRFSVPGMKMIIVGRSPEPAAESSETAGVETLDELRRIYLNRAGTSGKAKTPAQVERQIKELLKQRATRHNLDRLRQRGVQVEYQALDVRTEAFGALIDRIYSNHGRLDAVIHGAGIIEDKLLLDKSQSSFDRVFDTKVDSAYILSRHLRADSLKLVVLFSSVAALIGNAGQADYAAANEVLNCFAWRMSQDWPQARVVAINWGPWKDVGMASDAVNRRFKTRGIVPISPDAGSNFFLREIFYGGPESVEVIAGEGPWRSEPVDPVSLDDLGDMVLQLNTLAEDFWAM